MPDDYKISDLSNVVEISNNDLMEISAVNSSSDTGYSSVKATMTQIAEKIANGVQYSADLETTSKTLVGAINEVNAGGGASSLDDLGDVDIDSPQDKQVLLYDDANDEWVNGDNVAKSLAESIKTTEETPYQYRQTPLTANRTLEKLIGVSCAFNQLVQNGNFEDTSNWASSNITYGTINASNNALEMSIVNVPPNSYTPFVSQSPFTMLANHKYFIGFDFSSPYLTDVRVETQGGSGVSIPLSKTGSFERLDIIYTRTSDSINSSLNVYPRYSSGNWADGDKWYIKNVNVIDLTAMFGSEVADYLYTLESNTAGSGIALFRQLFPEDYYAYQTATLISSKPVSKVIKDSNDQTIATYPLGGDELRGLLKVENGQLVAYGDVKPSDGNGTEYFDIVDLSTLAWTDWGNGIYGTEFNSANMVTGYDDISNAIAEKYINSSWGTVVDDSTPLTMVLRDVGGTKYLAIVSGVGVTPTGNLIYEKATPTAKSYTPFTNPMICGSTEEFTDSRSLKMFCGHQSQYYTETEGDKLAALPEVTGERGRFVIESYGGKMSLSQIKDITGTLTAGSTSITLSDASITTESTIDVYTDTFGVNPTNVVVATGSVTLTFEAQANDVAVKVRIT